MISPRPLRRFTIFLITAGLLAGCSRLMSVRHGVVRSFDTPLDSRRAPAIQLAGCFIPETFPAISKLPIVFSEKIPRGAKFTSASVEILTKNDSGDPLALLKPVIEDNQVYLKFAVSKKDAFTQVTVAVTANYDYRR